MALPWNGTYSFTLPPNRYTLRANFGSSGYRVQIPPHATEFRITAEATDPISLYVRHQFPNVMRFEGEGVEPTIITDASTPSADRYRRAVLNRESKPPLSPGSYHIGIVDFGHSSRLSGRIRTTATLGGGTRLGVRPQAATLVTSFGRLPAVREIKLTHAGCSPVRYSIGTNASWLKVEPSLWEPQNGEQVALAVSIADPSLSVGDRTASVVIRTEETASPCEPLRETLIPFYYVVTQQRSSTTAIRLRESAPRSVIRIDDDAPLLGPQ